MYLNLNICLARYATIGKIHYHNLKGRILSFQIMNYKIINYNPNTNKFCIVILKFHIHKTIIYHNNKN